MEEAIIDNALETCFKLQKSLSETLDMVADMNVRYNCVAKNWRTYIRDIIAKYKLPKTELRPMPAIVERPFQSTELVRCTLRTNIKKRELHDLTPRSSQELLGLNTTLNYRFIKIKRNLESVMSSIRRTIRIAERQADYTQMDLNWRLRKFDFVR